MLRGTCLYVEAMMSSVSSKKRPFASSIWKKPRCFVDIEYYNRENP